MSSLFIYPLIALYLSFNVIPYKSLFSIVIIYDIVTIDYVVLNSIPIIFK